MEISVIIPVYNAASFVTQAVESALSQPETGEVILIEDGSPDDSLQVCQELAEKYKKVRLLQHPGSMNKGAGASRNLGMQNAKFDYIAFLDADDFFLPGRFTVAKEIFEKNLECDGVYEALGIYFENEEARSKWLESNMRHVNMTTMTKVIEPKDLFENLIEGRSGNFSLDALVFKKALINNAGFMNEDLRLHQDTDFIFKLTACGHLLPGRLDEPVAMRRVHGENRISAKRSSSLVYKNRMRQWKSTYNYLKNKGMHEQMQLVLKAMIWRTTKSKHFDNSIADKIPDSILRRIRLFLWAVEWPEALMHKVFWQKLFQRVW